MVVSKTFWVGRAAGSCPKHSNDEPHDKTTDSHLVSVLSVLSICKGPTLALSGY